jgi:ribosomal protein L37AE/L43A
MSTDEKPSRNEEEYFARRNAELIKEQRARLDESRKNQERASHYMKCPKCGGDLREREFHHMRIDQCSDCGGTWLDKGEMEMLAHVERSQVGRFIGSMFGLKN